MPLNANNCPEISTFDIEKMMGMFTLKLMAQYSLPEHVIDDIISFSSRVQTAKTDLITDILKKRYSDHQSIENLCSEIEILGKNVGQGNDIATHFKREKYIANNFDYVKPERIPIENPNGPNSFYMSLPIKKTLRRLLSDQSLRDYIIHYPVFSARLSVRIDFKLQTKSLTFFVSFFM